MQFTKSFVESATFIASETKYIFCGEKKEFKYLFLSISNKKREQYIFTEINQGFSEGPKSRKNKHILKEEFENHI